MSRGERVPTTCKGCGKKIVWVNTAQGKKIPLDPTPPTYDHIAPGVYARSSAMVSHFATCPKANDFSASNKQPVQGTLL